MKFLEVFLTALKLGLTSFGGPVAHLSFFRSEYVEKKRWICDRTYADLVALCQFLPGPASSQVGMAIGLTRAGVFGAFLSWFGFTLPSALILIALSYSFSLFDLTMHLNWIHGLKVVVVAVVAQAVYGMGKKLCPDKERVIIGILSCIGVVYISSALGQIIVLLIAGLFGLFFLKSQDDLPHEPFHNGPNKVSFIFLFVFVGLLFLLPLLRAAYPLHELEIFDSFYRVGSLVFGGGHVVLPMLQAEVVPSGWVSKDLFMAGYGVANAIPGPLFTFSAYLGAVSALAPNGIVGGALSLIAIFLPSFLLIIGILPIWERIRSISKIRQAMLGINAAVVGILLAALCGPVWTSAILSFRDIALATICFVLLEILKMPSWAVVLLGSTAHILF